MKAFAITRTTNLSTGQNPLELIDMPVKEPGRNEILIKVSCCGVCHTELDEIEGRTPPSDLPRVPGHQVVGVVERLGAGASRFRIGDRVGVAWIYDACGTCEYCRAGFENLCPGFRGTGRDNDGGYAEYMTIDEDFAFALPAGPDDVSIAPLLCAGAIGYRALRLTQLKDGESLGLAGFGASGHLVLKMVRGLYPNTKTYVFARSIEEQKLAMQLGATWAGTFDEKHDVLLNAIIDTTPVWKPSIDALLRLKPGGRLVINAIRKEDVDKTVLQSLTYEHHLWMEKEIKTVANIARQDVEEFLALVARIQIQPEIQIYDFMDANQALLDLKFSHVHGAKVLLWNSANLMTKVIVSTD
jgi:propanol-preferring alcohol dehydrogenase